MRIIAGRLKGRKLRAPVGHDVRPTSDSLRETLFNVLGDLAEGARVLDGFAGTGALGLEAYSRGATSVTFIEHDRAALKALAANIDACGVSDACVIIRGDFMAVHVESPRFDLVLLDPPYRMDNIEGVLAQGAALLTATGTLVLEHSRRRPAPERVDGAFRYRVLTAGDSALSFYAPPT